MKLKTKFFLFSGLSLLLGIIILFTILYGVSKSTNITNSMLSFESAIHNQALRSSASREIQIELQKGIEACQYNERNIINNELQNIKNIIAKYNNTKEHTELLSQSEEVNQNIKTANNLFNTAVEDALHLTNNIGNSNISNNLKIIVESFNQANQINDILYYQIVDLRNETRKEAMNVIRQIIGTSTVIAAFLIFIVCFITILANYTLFKPLEKIINIMKLVQENHFNKEIPYTSREDEIGDIAIALKVFSTHNYEKSILEENIKKQEIIKQEDRHQHMIEFAEQLESSIKEISDAVALAANRVDKTAKALANQSNSIKDETSQLAKSSLETNNNIQEVSKSSTEFIESSNKITAQVINAKKYTDKTSKQTINANKLINKLEDKASAISEVIDLINHITSQIEILALNASIEASRAGEFGKGFTVVANEVKGLASQTRKATEQVNSTISSMQDSTKDAVEAIKEIIKSIETINDTSSSISTVIDEQNNTTTRIVSKVSKIAAMSNSINSSIDKVAKSSTESGQSALTMLEEAAALSEQATILKKKVDDLLLNLKNN